MKDTPRDYTKLTAIAKNCGMVEYKKWGVIHPAAALQKPGYALKCRFRRTAAELWGRSSKHIEGAQNQIAPRAGKNILSDPRAGSYV